MTRSTPSHAAPTTGGLTVGDRAPAYAGMSHAGDGVSSDTNVGHPVVLFFLLHSANPRCEAKARAFRDLNGEFAKFGVRLIGTSAEPAADLAALAGRLSLPFPLLPGPDAALALAYGAAEREPDGDRLSVGRRTVLIDPNHRVAGVFNSASDDPAAHATEVLAAARHLLREDARDVVSHAPVLMIPNVLPPAVCRRLMDLWEQENRDSGSMAVRDGKTVEVFDYGHKFRRDHFLTAMGLDDSLVMTYVADRVVPEISKAYHYRVTRKEDFRVACYDASRGGYFRPHRDNTTPGTAHRRFAMSLLLNDDYEGGFLRFPEYGRHRYRSAAGGAVVFSCSLLHEATDVTAGRRFVLLSFLYGEAEARMREEYAKRSGDSYRA